MITTDALKSGMAIRLDGTLYRVVDFQHVKPGKGGAFVRIKLRNMKLKTVIERTFSSGEKLEDVFLDQRRWTCLYRQGDTYYFMDQEDYEQKAVSREDLKEAAFYLKDDLEVTACLAEGEVVEIVPPTFVELKIVQTAPGLRGDTAKGGTKPAEVETGLTVQVPLFVNADDVIRVDTRTNKYMERV